MGDKASLQMAFDEMAMGARMHTSFISCHQTAMDRASSLLMGEDLFKTLMAYALLYRDDALELSAHI